MPQVIVCNAPMPHHLQTCVSLCDAFTFAIHSSAIPLQFNPYHVGAISDAFLNALELEREERRARFDNLLDWVRTNPASLWAQRVLLDLKNARKNTRIFTYEGMGMGPRYRIMTTRSGFTRLDNENVLEAFRKAKRRLILLDIGGTLVHQVKVDSLGMYSKSYSTMSKHLGSDTASSEKQDNENNMSRPPRAVMEALRALAADTRRNAVYLVSGQDRATVASHFEEIPRLGIVTDSGYAFRNAGEANIHSWETMDEHFDLSWVETVREILKIYTFRTVGTYIERKKFAMLWRFADADPEYGALQVSEFIVYCVLNFSYRLCLCLTYLI